MPNMMLSFGRYPVAPERSCGATAPYNELGKRWCHIILRGPAQYATKHIILWQVQLSRILHYDAQPAPLIPYGARPHTLYFSGRIHIEYHVTPAPCQSELGAQVETGGNLR